MAVSDADFAKLRADLTAATAALATLRGQTLLLASQQNDLALQLASGIVVRRRILTATPAIPQGYGVVAVNGGVQVADVAGLALVALPSGIAIAGGQPDDYVYIATGGIRPNSETNLGGGVAGPVGQDINGRLVRATDPTCVPGTYYGDCNTAGDMTIRIRPTAATSDYVIRAWLQDWEISVNGDDRNTGLPGSPIKTGEEQFKRLGEVHEVSQSVTTTLLTSLPNTDRMHFNIRARMATPPVFNKNFVAHRIKGIPTLVASGTITGTIRVWDQATNVWWGIETSLGDMSTHIRPGRIFKRTNGDPTYPTKWWLAKDEGANVYRISFPTQFSANDEVNCGNSPSPAMQVGDTFEIYDLPELYVPNFSSESGGFFSTKIDGIYCRGQYPTVQRGGVIFTECAFENFATVAGTQANITNCQLNGFEIGTAGSYWYVTFGLSRSTLRSYSGFQQFQNYHLRQGGTQLRANDCAQIHCHTRGIGVYDQALSGLTIYPGEVLTWAGGLMGEGNTRYGVEVYKGGKIIVGGLGASGGRFFRATGTIGDMLICGRTSGPAKLTASPWGYTDDRAYTHDLFNTSVAGGGFNQQIVDPEGESHGIFRDF